MKETYWMSRLWLEIIFYCSTICTSTNAFNILVLFPTPSYSHQRPIMALTERLVEEGHKLFVVSPNVVPGLEQHENYTFVDVSFSYKIFSDDKKDDAIVLQDQMSKWAFLKFAPFLASIPGLQYLSEAFKNFERQVESNEITFDVVIIESGYISSACAMARKLSGSVPTISMTSFSRDFTMETSLGSIFHASFVPSVLSDYTNRMSLWQKIENWFSDYYLCWYYESVYANAARQFFKDNYDAESLVDGCVENVSLVLVTSNPMYYYPRLLGPNVIETGPLHLKTPTKLPKNLQEWLDGAEKGAIYFSLGSNMKTKSLSPDVRNNLMKFFKELPIGYRVLWKAESYDGSDEMLSNILMQKWVPQESVLAHPKVRVFITQGGLQSVQEAIHYGVPMVGIPWFADQGQQVTKIAEAKIGVRLMPSDLHSFIKIETAIENVLYDDSYWKNMQRYSAISRDFSSVALDKAVFWVQHVAKHGGAAHLRPRTADTTFFEYFCLDIISVLLLFISMLLMIFYFICNRVRRVISERSSKKIKKS